MIIALFINEKKKDARKIASETVLFLENKGIRVVAEDKYCQEVKAQPLTSVDPTSIDFIISLGGDGTILSLSKVYGHLKAAILGINLGHLGFMADVPIVDIKASLQDLLDGKYKIENRLMLEASSPNQDSFFAANDFVIHRSQNHSLIEMSVAVDGQYLNTFLADGLILATPTGSTAYSLAAGGPILAPDTEAFVLTPICAHTISNRPIVLSSSAVIEVQYLSEYEPVNVWADGIENYPLKPQEKTLIKKSSQVFKLVKLDRYNYYTTLRKKLALSGKLH